MKRHTPKRLTATLLLTGLGLATMHNAGALEIDMPMTRADSGNYYVNGQIEDAVDTSFLLDTGSGYVTLSESTFSQVRKTTSPEATRHIRGRMANGETVTAPVYTLNSLELSGCTIKDVEVVVMPGADRDILGLSALRRMQPFTIDMETPTLSANC